MLMRDVYQAKVYTCGGPNVLKHKSHMSCPTDLESFLNSSTANLRSFGFYNDQM